MFAQSFDGLWIYGGLGFRVYWFMDPKGPKYTHMGESCPNHNSNSLYRNPTFYYRGTLDPLGDLWIENLGCES